VRWTRAISGWLQSLRPPTSLDQRGERAAEKYLKRQGYKIIARRLRLGGGELDLIAADGRTLVFVEVKTRVSHDKGHPAEAVDEAKQRQLTRLGLIYLKRHDLLGHSARFDVVAVTWPKGAKRPSIEHYRSAFEPTGAGQMFS
jgi:putative endonuclease